MYKFKLDTQSFAKVSQCVNQRCAPVSVVLHTKAERAACHQEGSLPVNNEHTALQALNIGIQDKHASTAASRKDRLAHTAEAH